MANSRNTGIGVLSKNVSGFFFFGFVHKSPRPRKTRVNLAEYKETYEPPRHDSSASRKASISEKSGVVTFGK